MASDNPGKSGTGRKPKSGTSRRTTPDPLTAAAPAKSEPAFNLSDADVLYESKRTQLVERGDFGLLETEARTYIWDDVDAPTAGTRSPGQEAYWSELLFHWTRRAVQELARIDRVAAVALVKVYLTKVLPRVLRAGVEAPNVKRFLKDVVLFSEFDPDELRATPAGPVAAAAVAAAPVPPPAQPDIPPPADVVETAPSVIPAFSMTQQFRQEGAKPQSQPRGGGVDPEVEPDGMTRVTYEEIRRNGVIARRNKRKTLIVVGLASTGKTFLSYRLAERLGRQGYGWMGLRGLALRDELEVGATKNVLLHKFDRMDRPKAQDNFDLYDLPGDQFVKLVRSGGHVSPDDVEVMRLIYAICAFADAMIFIAPSLHVLKPATFRAKGDDLDLSQNQIEERLKDMKIFINSMGPMSRVIGLLKQNLDAKLKGVKLRGPDAEAELERATDEAIEPILKMSFQQIQEVRPKSDRIRMPALLLLSRADELERSLPADARADYDADPALQLVARHKELFSTLSGRFDSFGVDFITAQRNDTPTTTFEDEKPSAGVTHLIHDWMMPSIRLSRKPAWMRYLLRPAVAVWWRRLLDREFRAEWAQIHNTRQ